MTIIAAGLAARRLIELIQDDVILDPVRSRFYRRFPAKGSIELSTRSTWISRHDPATNEPVLVPRVVDVTRPPGKAWTALDDGQGNKLGWTAPEGTWLGRMVNCPRCLGVWTAAAVLIARRVRGVRFLAAVLTVAGAVRAFEDVHERLGTGRSR